MENDSKAPKTKLLKVVKKSLNQQDKIKKKGLKAVKKQTKKIATAKDFLKKKPGPLGATKSVTEL